MNNRAFLLEYFGDKSRKGGAPNQFMLENSEIFLEFYKYTVLESVSCYISVNPFSDLKTISGVEKIYFDFDSKESMDKAYKEFRLVNHSFSNEYGIDTLNVFSGNKGYNLYVYLPEFKIAPADTKIFTRKLMDILLEPFIDEKGKIIFDYFDVGCTKDPSRISRTPFSVHPKSQRQCKVIHTTNPLQTLKDAKRNCLPMDIVKKALFETEKVKIRNEFIKREPRSSGKGWRQTSRVRPCIIEALNNPSVRDGVDHQNRIAYVIDAQHANLSVDKMVSAISSRYDFDPELTREVVEDILRRKYEYRMSCESLKRLGICGNQCGRA